MSFRAGGGFFSRGWATLLSAFFFATAAFPQSVTPGDPFPISLPVVDAAPFGRDTPRVASNGSDFLVVWIDRGRDPNPSIFFTRVDASGKPLDAVSRRLTRPGGQFGSPIAAVASDGDSYLVAYSCSSQSTFSSKVCVDSISSSGELRAVDSDAGAGLSMVEGVALAWNGEKFLLAVSDSRLGLGAELLDRTGRVLKPRFFLGYERALSLSVASHDGEFYVVSRVLTLVPLASRFGILGSAVSASGVPAPSVQIASVLNSGVMSGPRIVADDRGYLVVWDEVVPPDNGPLSHRRINGRLIRDNQVSGDILPLVRNAAGSALPSISWNGQRYLLSYSEFPHGLDVAAPTDSDVRAVELDDAARPAPREEVHLAEGPARQVESDVAWNGSEWLAVWTDDRTDQRSSNERKGEIVGRVIPSDPGSAGFNDGIVLSRSLTLQQQPAAAVGNSVTLVSWEETTGIDQHRNVFVAPMPSNGIPAIRGIAVNPTPREQRWPSVSWNGDQFLIVWIEYERSSLSSELWGALVAARGGAALVLPPFKISSSAKRARPAVEWNGSTHLVVFSNGASQLSDVRVGKQGSGSISPELILVTEHQGYEPAISWNGSSYLIAYSVPLNLPCQITCGVPRPGIRALLADREGLRLGGETLLISPTPASRASVAWNGREHLIVWASDFVYGTRVTPSGNVVAANVKLGAYRSEASVGWSGMSWAVASTTIAPEGGSARYKLRLNFFNPALDAQRNVPSREPNDVASPVVIASTTGPVTVLYESAIPTDPWFYVARIFGSVAEERASVRGRTTRH